MRDMTAFAPDAPTDPPADGRGPVATSLPHPVKPKLRGWLHLGMFPAALVAGLVLTALRRLDPGPPGLRGLRLTACLLFGVSALYPPGRLEPTAWTGCCAASTTPTSS
ncbi:hypothetical protein GCM10023238_35070 [Streptomyces heliomycini]